MNRKLWDQIATSLFYLSSLVIVSILGWFLFTIFYQGLPIVNWHFLTSFPSELDAGGGIGPMIFNTFYLLFMTLCAVIPVGVLAGIYLAEYAPDNWLTRFVRLCVESLASVPSIVFGLFGMILFVVKMGWSFSLIGGALTLAMMNLPVIVRITEEALRAVPYAYREASYALGATKWQTIRKVVLPAATPSFLTGVNLAIGRTIGESSLLVFTAGTSITRNFPEWNPFAASEVLSVHLWYVKAVAIIPDAAEIASGTAVVLILIVMILNIVISLIKHIVRRKFEGSIN